MFSFPKFNIVSDYIQDRIQSSSSLLQEITSKPSRFGPGSPSSDGVAQSSLYSQFHIPSSPYIRDIFGSLDSGKEDKQAAPIPTSSSHSSVYNVDKPLPVLPQAQDPLPVPCPKFSELNPIQGEFAGSVFEETLMIPSVGGYDTEDDNADDEDDGVVEDNGYPTDDDDGEEQDDSMVTLTGPISGDNIRKHFELLPRIQTVRFDCPVPNNDDMSTPGEASAPRSTQVQCNEQPSVRKTKSSPTLLPSDDEVIYMGETRPLTESHLKHPRCLVGLHVRAAINERLAPAPAPHSRKRHSVPSPSQPSTLASQLEGSTINLNEPVIITYGSNQYKFTQEEWECIKIQHSKLASKKTFNVAKMNLKDNLFPSEWETEDTESYSPLDTWEDIQKEFNALCKEFGKERPWEVYWQTVGRVASEVTYGNV
ncbi:hypothetical protein C8Q75DRAFT_807458 [Abortiporus biennis]|nr:hypothetical protein C8Q75DRAFT_807458 [Abortiporus biennis]